MLTLSAITTVRTHAGQPLPSNSPALPKAKAPQLPSWPMQGGGPAHTRAQGADVGAPPVSKLEEVWHSSLISRTTSEPTGSAGTVYVTHGDRELRALDTKTGSVKWRFATSGPVTAPPTVHGSTIAFTDSEGTLYNLDSSTGQTRWRRQADYAATAVTIAAPAPGRAPWIYVATPRGPEALDLTGRHQWAFPTRSALSTPLSIEGGRAYFGSRDTSMYAIDALTGRLLWSTRIGSPISTPASVDGTSVYVGSTNGQIRALSTSSGVLQWGRRTGSAVKQPIAVGQSGRTKAVFAVAGRKVIALVAADGRLSWTHPTATTQLSAPSLAGGQLLLGEGNRVIALDPETGRTVWQKALDGQVAAPVMTEGRLLIATAGQQLHAFDPHPHLLVRDRRALPSPAPSLPIAPSPATPAR
ncbi:PQQ-binding-like beta-propeller repeat protein [Streptomyces sp. NPDC051577]|uniref:outer membrane protein assembly factor BamB family protein n=1 Tax=Streptomyces sp. NPDC051577 TaxID=3155166 RepID=UPI00344030D3